MYNVYLKDEVAATKGFMKTTHHDGSLSHHMRLHHGDGGSDGRWRFVLGPDAKEVPQELVDLVEEVSFMADIPIFPHRELGVYRYGTARAQVTLSPVEARIDIHITGKNLADVRELHHKILDGTIRPEESYEGEQVGISRRELEEELVRLHDFELKARKQWKNLQQFVDELRKEQWPVCHKGRVADTIEHIMLWVNPI